jgi:hypothetical protein
MDYDMAKSNAQSLADRWNKAVYIAKSYLTGDYCLLSDNKKLSITFRVVETVIPHTCKDRKRGQMKYIAVLDSDDKLSEEAIENIKHTVFCGDEQVPYCFDIDSIEESKLILKLLEQGSILDQIKAEVREWYWQADKQALAKDPCVVDAMVDLFIRTINKYKADEKKGDN